MKVIGVQRQLIERLCTNLLTICYLTDQTYAYSNRNNISIKLRHSSYDIRGLDVLAAQPPYMHRLILTLTLTIKYC
jgi:hypothetical protein